MKTIRTLADAQLAVNELLEFKQRLDSQNTDLRGRRFTNVGAALDVNEYTTLAQLNDVKRTLQDEIKGLKNEIERLEKRVKALE